MAALLGLDAEAAGEVAARGGATARSARSPTTTAAGRSWSPAHKAAVERAVEIAKAQGAKRAMMLPCPRRSIAR